MGIFLAVNEPSQDTPGAGPERRPRSLADMGMRVTVLEDLALKTLYQAGPMTTRELARQTKIGQEVMNELFARMRADLLCQVTGMTGNAAQIAITTQGRTRALELLAHSQYAGPAPVTLESYVAQVRRQSVREVVVHAADVDRAFSQLVIDGRTLAQIGTALNSGGSIFLHGPSGVGKTTIAETIAQVLAVDDVWIPYAVEADGQIISVYDPVVHQQIETPALEMPDERWVRCHRPSIVVGGELTIGMLDLQFNAATKYYVGPVQMKANNGILIIDDFGRQRVRPEELLNRWVVPLDRGVDFLTLAGGSKIEIPFEMLVVFATNMDPAELVDAAFLRRMQTKIRIGWATDEQFCEIFRRVARARELTVEDSLLRELIGKIRGTLRQELRACYPRDLTNQVCWTARYEDRPPRLDRESLMAAVEAYFLAGN